MSRSEEDGLVKVTREGKKLIIEVDRHTKMNGFTPSMFDGISAAYEELEKDDVDIEYEESSKQCGHRY